MELVVWIIGYVLITFVVAIEGALVGAVMGCLTGLLCKGKAGAWAGFIGGSAAGFTLAFILAVVSYFLKLREFTAVVAPAILLTGIIIAALIRVYKHA
jgi:ABC-type uncharacterized transport system permease subunit